VGLSILVLLFGTACFEKLFEPAEEWSVSSLEVLPASITLLPAATHQFEAHACDQNGNVHTDVGVQWSTSNAAVAAVDNLGLVTAQAEGSASIRATVQGLSAAAAVLVAEKTADGQHPNEPVGYMVITERPFDAGEENGWGLFSQNFSIVEDPNAPRSPPNVGRFRFRAGAVEPGKSLNPGATSFLRWSAREVYFEFWLKLSSNWQNHETTTNKIFYITDASTGGGGDPLYINAHGDEQFNPTSSMHLTGQLQHPNWQNRALDQNLTRVELVRGQWYHVEVVLKMNTAVGLSDGEFHMWIDGTKVSEHTNVRWSDGDRTWDRLAWNPIWGGQQDAVQEEMYQYVDHIYLSGK
jgi:hypothetical protein